MKTLFLPGQNGYAIPLVHTLTGKEEKVCLLTHGFGSSKDSPTARLALAQFPAWGIGVAALDLPAHGESPVSGHFLRIENCLNDLAAVEAWIIGICPQAEILYFSSSFGAYLNLIYLARRPHKGTHSFLRSAAVGMPQLFAGAHGAEGPGRKAHGPFVLDQGYERPILITDGFLQDLAQCDVFTLYRPGPTQVRMVHGECDEVAPLSDAQRFAEKFHIPLCVIPHGDHRLSIPGAPEAVFAQAKEFYQNPSPGCGPFFG